MTEERPELLTQASLQDWAQGIHPSLWVALDALGRTEHDKSHDWVLPDEPGDALYERLDRMAGHLALAPTLSALPMERDDAGKERPKLGKVLHDLAYVSAPRRLRMLALMIRERHPGLGAALVRYQAAHARESGDPQRRVVTDSIRVLVRYDTYRRIFGPERRAHILYALQKARAERENAEDTDTGDAP